MTNTNTTSGYIVRSEINPNTILCTDGEFHADGFTGPGHDLEAKIYKTRRNAEKVRNGAFIIVRKWNDRNGEEA